MRKRRIPPSEEALRQQRLTPTPKQARILECIRAHIRERGFAPTRAELARDIGTTQTSIDHQLEQLSQKGWAQITPYTQRGIRLIREGAPIIECGAAPEPAALDPDAERIETVEDLLGERPDLYVKITDVAAAGRQPGDVIAIAKSRAPRPGEHIAVRMNETIELRPYTGAERPDDIVGVATHAVVTLRTR